MEREELSVDVREQRLVAAERAIGRLRELQLEDLALLGAAQVATGDFSVVVGVGSGPVGFGARDCEDVGSDDASAPGAS